ncbi:MAG: hypothetical protein ABIF08_02755 [Nanoarchaeota archaeon]
MDGKKLIILTLVLSFSCMISSSEAIGVSPSRLVIDFEPGLQEIREFSILNNGENTLNIEIYKKGDLAEYITLYDTASSLEPGERKYFTYDINLPETLEGFGIFDTRIGAVEAAPEGSMMGGRAAVESQLWIKKLFDGKYAEVNLILNNIYAGDIMNFRIKISNFGTETIDCDTILKIYNSNDESVKEIALEDIVISFDVVDYLNSEWDTETVEAGDYKAVAIVSYNGKEATDEKMFTLVQTEFEDEVDVNTESNDIIIGDTEKPAETIAQVTNEGFPIQYLLIIFFIGIGLIGAILYFTKLRVK